MVSRCFPTARQAAVTMPVSASASQKRTFSSGVNGALSPGVRLVGESRSGGCSGAAEVCGSANPASSHATGAECGVEQGRGECGGCGSCDVLFMNQIGT